MQRTRVLIGAVAVIVAAVAVAGYLIAAEPLRSDLAVQDRAAADLLKRMGYHEPGQFALAIWKRILAHTAARRLGRGSCMFGHWRTQAGKGRWWLRSIRYCFVWTGNHLPGSPRRIELVGSFSEIVDGLEPLIWSRVTPELLAWRCFIGGSFLCGWPWPPEKYAAAMELPEVRARQEDLRAQLAHLGWLAVAIAGGSLFAGAVVAALLPTGRKRA